jgi:hypothetical protein
MLSVAEALESLLGIANTRTTVSALAVHVSITAYGPALIM